MQSLRSAMAASDSGTAQPGEALALFSVDGRLLRETAAARCLFHDVPTLQAQLKQLLRLQLKPGSTTTGQLITGRERFVVRLTFIDADLLGTEPSVLIAVERAADHELEVALLRDRFGFTKRQAEVALLIMARRSNLEIADHFRISRHTARHHVQAVLTKLGVKSRSKARQILVRGGDSRRTS